MGRAAAVLAGVLALAGCAGPQGLPLGPTVGVAAPPNAAVQGQADLVVRTFVADEAGGRRELGGARCTVRTVLFQTELTTPARLVFPSFGPQSPTLDIACAAGELSGRATQGVVTRWVRSPGAWPGPGPWGWPYADPWGWGYRDPWGWGGWDGPNFPVFAYPDVDVALR